MTPELIIGIITLVLTYAGALISIYTSMKVKLKELDIKILSIQNELTEFKNNTIISQKELYEEHKKDHQKLNDKLDIMLEKIYEMKK